jgi:hypothetical protein
MTLYRVTLILLPTFLINIPLIPQEELSLLMAQGQQGKNNTYATDRKI